MPEIARHDGDSAPFELDFVEREATQEPLMKLSIHLHAAGLSLSNTVSVFENFGVDRVRSIFHSWIRNAKLKYGKSPDHVAIDESVIQLNDERNWRYAAVDPETNVFHHVDLYNRCIAVYSTRFISELLKKHDLKDAVFLVDDAPWLHTVFDRLGCDFHHETHGRRNAVERFFKEVKRRTYQSSNHYRHTSIDLAES